MSSFDSLGLQEDLVRCVSERGWDLPRDVQDESIPSILNGNDVLIASETGSGKTGALGLPMLQLIHEFTTAKGSFNLETEHIVPALEQLTPTNVGINIEDCEAGWDFHPPSSSTFNPQTISATWTRSGMWGGLRANVGACRGKYYFEAKVTSGHLVRIGLAMKTASPEIGQDINSIGWGSTGFLVHGGKFMPIPGQNSIFIDNAVFPQTVDPTTSASMNDDNANVVSSISLIDGLSPNPTIVSNPDNSPQTPEQREMVCYHIGDTIGFAADFDNNELILYRVRPPASKSSSSASEQHTGADSGVVTTRIAIIKDPFYPDIFYYPSLCVKDSDSSIALNLHGPFLNPVFAVPRDSAQDLTLPLRNGYQPFAQCVTHYHSPQPQPIFQVPSTDDTIQPTLFDSAYTSYYTPPMEANIQNKSYLDFLHSTAQKPSNIKGVIITPNPGLCEQMYNDMLSFSKYLDPPVAIGMSVSSNDPRFRFLHQYDIIIGTIGLLEQQFGTSLVDRPRFNPQNGAPVTSETNNKRRQNLDISQTEFDGTMTTALTVASADHLTAQIKMNLAEAKAKEGGIGALLGQKLTLLESGPLLNNCIFLTIDEADTFGDRLNSEILHRILARIKRDKDRAMTHHFLATLAQTKNQNDQNGQNQPPTEIPISGAPHKVPHCQVVMASATIDQEKMKTLFPLLRKSYSTVHLRERYELPKGLLQGAVYINGSRFIPHLNRNRSGNGGEGEDAGEDKDGNENGNGNGDKEKDDGRFWPSQMIPDKFLDGVHEFGVKLPDNNPFHRLLLPPGDKESGNEKGHGDRADTVLNQKIIESQGSKMYKMAVLGNLLSILTQTKSRFSPTLSLQTVVQALNPQDFSHLNVDLTDGGDDMTALVDENGESVVVNTTTDTQAQPTETQTTTTSPTPDSFNLLTSLTNINPTGQSQTSTKGLNAVEPAQLDKFIVFCQSNNDCIRVAMYISSLIEQSLITLPDVARKPVVADTAEQLDENDNANHNNQKNKRPKENKQKKKNNGPLSYQESQALSDYPSNILLQLNCHPAVACLINKGQSKEQLSQICADFQSKKVTFLVCTDLGSRGFDFQDVPVILHFNTPRHPEIYVQRCGRTARGSTNKLGLSLCLVNTAPEFIWYHAQMGHASDECESSTIAADSKLLKQQKQAGTGAHNNDVALESSSHPCVQVQHEKIYIEDIQEKINIRLPPIIPMNFKACSVEVAVAGDQSQSGFLMLDDQDQDSTHSTPSPSLLDGYDSIIGDLHLRQKQEDICALLHKQNAHVILTQNALLSELQNQLQHGYFNVLNRCPLWDNILSKDQPPMDQSDEVEFYSDVEGWSDYELDTQSETGNEDD